MQGPRFLSHYNLPRLTRSKSSQDASPRAADSVSVSPPELDNNELPPEGELQNAAPSQAKVPTARELEGDLGKQHKTRWRQVKIIARRHLKFLGPGVVASVAYCDPGNWATNLKAGSAFGYAHLFVVLMAGLFAVLFQIMCTRLGCVTGKDLAEHCRAVLHDRPRHKMFWRWGVLYPLYFVCECGIIFTDLAELLGSAIALNMLIPSLPLWGGVLLTSLDVFVILLFFNNYPSETVSRSMYVFEAFISILVFVVLASFIVLLVRVSPDWGDAFHGYLPSNGFIDNGALYTAVGIIGATVMPHALILGSRIATMDRMGDSEDSDDTDGPVGHNMPPRPRFAPALHLPQPVSSFPLSPRRAHGDDDEAAPKRRKRSFRSYQVQVRHASFDIAFSLVIFALTINSAILILGSTAFYYAPGGQAAGPDGVADLLSAYQLLREQLGSALAYLFAVALLASSQAASVTVTLAGQTVSEGFLHWSTSPFVRRVVTRLISILPSVAVSASVGRKGTDTLLVASQVALSMVLPFVIGPLILLTTSHKIMGIEEPLVPAMVSSGPPPPPSPSFASKLVSLGKSINPLRSRGSDSTGKPSFANSVWVIELSVVIFALVVVANVYAIIQIALDSSAA